VRGQRYHFLRAIAALALAACDGGERSGGSGALDPAACRALADANVDETVVSQPDEASVTEGETDVAVSAAGVTAAAWIARDCSLATHIACSFSRDGGRTWTPPAAVLAPQAGGGSDPVLAAGAEGEIHLVWLGLAPGLEGDAPFGATLLAATAAPGEIAPGAAVRVAGGEQDIAYDKPWAIASPGGALLVSFAAFDQPRASGLSYAKRFGVARGPATGPFSVAWVEGATGEVGSARLCASGGGRVFLVYIDQGVGAVLRWSDDDGASWPVASATPVSTPQQARDVAGADPSCVVEGARLWITYGLTDQAASLTAASSTPGLGAVGVARSDDGGKSIASRTTFAPDGWGRMRLPRLVGDAALLDLVFYAGGYDDDPQGALMVASSTDLGQTFGAPVVVRNHLRFTPSRSAGRWLGDYAGAARTGRSLSLAYTVNAGTPHVAFTRIER
jgi:hypothetical protein